MFKELRKSLGNLYDLNYTNHPFGINEYVNFIKIQRFIILTDLVKKFTTDYRHYEVLLNRTVLSLFQHFLLSTK